MANKSGKELEALIQQIETFFLPDNFDIKGNEKVYNDEGDQIAEFDIEIHGKLGSTDISWLIECRDRPSQGAAPGSWIEQLVGRKNRFGFNKVTAVSTTGFSESASEYAEEKGIELRTLKEITPEDISSWFKLENMLFTEWRADLEHISLDLSPDITEDVDKAIRKTKPSDYIDIAYLVSTKTGENVRSEDAFLSIVQQNNLFEKIEPDRLTQKVEIHVNYTNDSDHYIIETDEGNARIIGIKFIGTLTRKDQIIPVSNISEYAQNENGEVIAQVAGFKINVQHEDINIEFHNLSEIGEKHIVVRKIEK